MKKEYSDAEIVQAIQKGGKAMDKVMRYVYHGSAYRESVVAFILLKNGSLEDAEDVFQDGICHLVINIQKGAFRGESSLKTYLVTICKRLWFQKFNRSIKQSEILENQEIEKDIIKKGILILKMKWNTELIFEEI